MVPFCNISIQKLKISARNYGGGIPQMLEKLRRIISFISFHVYLILSYRFGDDFQVLPVKWHLQNIQSNQASKCSQVCTAHIQMNLASESHGIGAATSGAEKTSCNKYYFSLSVNTTCLASTRQCFDGKLMRSNSIPKGTSAAAAMHSCWIEISLTALSSHHHSYLLRLKIKHQSITH